MVAVVFANFTETGHFARSFVNNVPQVESRLWNAKTVGFVNAQYSSSPLNYRRAVERAA